MNNPNTDHWSIGHREPITDSFRKPIAYRRPVTSETQPLNDHNKNGEHASMSEMNNNDSQWSMSETTSCSVQTREWLENEILTICTWYLQSYISITYNNIHPQVWYHIILYLEWFILQNHSTERKGCVTISYLVIYPSHRRGDLSCHTWGLKDYRPRWTTRVTVKYHSKCESAERDY